ncbi:MAG: NUDIX domain-containing protein [Chloroflexota bacterium]
MDYIHWIRSFVGHQKIILTFASIALFDDQGRVLLQQRTDFDFWGLPGGILEFDETILDCAHRELLEETGLVSSGFDLVGVYTDPKYDVTYPNGDQVQQFTICLRGQVSGGVSRPDGVETTAQRFFAPSEIPFQLMPNWYLDMLKDALNCGPPAFTPARVGVHIIPQIEAVRPLIGTHRYIGPGASAITVRDDGRVLMIRRTDNGQWTFPAGFTDIGENVAHTAVRETLEETGIIALPERILGVFTDPRPWTYPNGDQIQFVTVMVRMHPAGGKLHADGVETKDAAWMTPAEILALENLPIFKQIHRTVLAHLDSGSFII